MKRPLVIPLNLELIELLFDQMSDVVFFLKDSDGRYVSVNTAFVERHGLQKKSQVLGKRPTDLCVGDFGNRPTQQDNVVLRTGRPLLNSLQMHWRALQQPGWCLTTKLPIRDGQGAIIGLIGVSRDVKSQIKVDEIPEGMAAALSHFEGHLTQQTTPSTMAAAAEMSLSRFSRLMNRLYGVSPNQRIVQIRCDAATHLLLNTERSVAEIAQQTGFYDHSSFTRAFRKTIGITPKRYRQFVDSGRFRQSGSDFCQEMKRVDVKIE
jgi:PAS domain S-box-containing protein